MIGTWTILIVPSFSCLLSYSGVPQAGRLLDRLSASYNRRFRGCRARMFLVVKQSTFGGKYQAVAKEIQMVKAEWG